MDKINIAVIGAGGIARSVHLPSLAEMDDVEVVAICDIVESRARRHFVDCVRSGTQPETSIQDAVKTFRWVEAILRGGI